MVLIFLSVLFAFRKRVLYDLSMFCLFIYPQLCSEKWDSVVGCFSKTAHIQVIYFLLKEKDHLLTFTIVFDSFIFKTRREEFS